MKYMTNNVGFEAMVTSDGIIRFLDTDIIEVWDDEKRAIRFLERMGYKKTGLNMHDKMIIAENLRTYKDAIGYISIVKADDSGYFIYTNESKELLGKFTIHCPDISFVNGWLEGVIYAAIG